MAELPKRTGVSFATGIFLPSAARPASFHSQSGVLDKESSRGRSRAGPGGLHQVGVVVLPQAVLAVHPVLRVRLVPRGARLGLFLLLFFFISKRKWSADFFPHDVAAGAALERFAA